MNGKIRLECKFCMSKILSVMLDMEDRGYSIDKLNEELVISIDDYEMLIEKLKLFDAEDLRMILWNLECDYEYLKNLGSNVA